MLKILTPGFVVPHSAFRVLLENDEDRLLVVFNRGLILMTEVSSSGVLMSGQLHIQNNEAPKSAQRNCIRWTFQGPGDQTSHARNFFCEILDPKRQKNSV